MREPIVSRILRYTLYAGFAAGAIITATLPFLLDKYFVILYDAYYLKSGYRTFILVFLMFVGLAGLWVILELIWMLRSIPLGPFIIRNVWALKRVGVIFFVLAVVFFGKCVLYVTILTMVGGALFLLGGLFSFTLASLFRQAVAFREENDLTI